MQRKFDRAAARYDAHAAFQQAQLRRVLAMAQPVIPAQAQLLDIGCGTGMLAQMAGAAWRIIGVDCAWGMCRQAQARCAAVVQADAVALPFAPASMDALVTSLCVQWVAPKAPAFAEMYRVLKPGGVAIVVTLGAQTLQELRALAVAMHVPLALLAMEPGAAYHAYAQAAGFAVDSLEDRVEIQHYASAQALLRSMRAIGANGVRGQGASPRSLRRLLAAYDATHRDAQGVLASWQPVVMQLRK